MIIINNDLIEMNLDSKVKFTLESNSNISFYGDELLIHQILINLITNAYDVLSLSDSGEIKITSKVEN